MNAALQATKEEQASAPARSIIAELAQFAWLPCTLSLEIPVSQFTIGDLLRLQKGSIVETAAHYASDVPVRVNGLLIGWTEFEVIGNRLAVRITELA